MSVLSDGWEQGSERRTSQGQEPVDQAEEVHRLVCWRDRSDAHSGLGEAPTRRAWTLPVPVAVAQARIWWAYRTVGGYGVRMCVSAIGVACSQRSASLAEGGGLAQRKSWRMPLASAYCAGGEESETARGHRHGALIPVKP